jgi:flagellum-specific peptidoglycan hydrolase FlgJ
MSKEEFIAGATAAAQISSATSDFPPGVTVAQAALESGWGSSALARLANNYFGIKSKPGSEAIELVTTEYVAGRAVRVTAKFAKYASMLECFADRDRMIASLSAYREARNAAKNPEAFIRALACHWATDPGYAEKVLAVYRANGLDKLDQQPAVASSQSPVGS